MKTCAVCQVAKPLEEFYKRLDSPDGFRNDCKVCVKSRIKTSYYLDVNASRQYANSLYKTKIQTNPGFHKEKYWANKEKSLAESRKSYLANRKKRLEKQAKWAMFNVGKANAIKKAYKVKKHNAMPKWLSEFDLLAIKCKYSVCAMLNKHGVEKWHVDHIVPLQGQNVSGLHVPWNLQVIPANENMRKSNRLLEA